MTESLEKRISDILIKYGVAYLNKKATDEIMSAVEDDRKRQNMEMRDNA